MVPCTRSSLVIWIYPEENIFESITRVTNSFHSFIDFYNKNVFSSIWQESALSRTQLITTLLRHHIYSLISILYPFINRITSEKMINCYHEYQQLDGRTRFLSFGFRYENGMRPWMFDKCRWMAATHFFAGLTHHPTHTSSRRRTSHAFILVLFPI